MSGRILRERIAIKMYLFEGTKLPFEYSIRVFGNGQYEDNVTYDLQNTKPLGKRRNLYGTD